MEIFSCLFWGAYNYSKLGIKFYKTFFYLDSPKEDRIKQLISFIEAHRNVIHHVKVLGNWDLEPEFEFYSENDFEEAIKELKDKFADIIKSVDVLTISKEHKFLYL